jgi:hypothetical protein
MRMSGWFAIGLRRLHPGGQMPAFTRVQPRPAFERFDAANSAPLEITNGVAASKQ